MSYAVGFDAAARADVRNLYDYILAEAGEPTARAYIERLLEYCAGLDTFSGAWHQA